MAVRRGKEGSGFWLTSSWFRTRALCVCVCHVDVCWSCVQRHKSERRAWGRRNRKMCEAVVGRIVNTRAHSDRRGRVVMMQSYAKGLTVGKRRACWKLEGGGVERCRKE